MHFFISWAVIRFYFVTFRVCYMSRSTFFFLLLICWKPHGLKTTAKGTLGQKEHDEFLKFGHGFPCFFVTDRVSRIFYAVFCFYLFVESHAISQSPPHMLGQRSWMILKAWPRFPNRPSVLFVTFRAPRTVYALFRFYFAESHVISKRPPGGVL